MVHVENSGVIFRDKKYAEKCWTHDLEALVELASLKPSLDADVSTNPALSRNWSVTKDWEETSRYEQKTLAEAQALYDAVADDPNGVLAWIRFHW